MRISWVARVGIGLLVAAVILFFVGKYWVETRTLRALNIPISLARDLEVNVMSDTACLNQLRPRLYIVASNWDFYKLNQHYENSCLSLFFMGLLGVILMIASIYEGLRARSEASSNPSILNV